jgi:hypothetical protein
VFEDGELDWLLQADKKATATVIKKILVSWLSV